MPRKYDRVIRFYSSWFADFLDKEKNFSDHEIVQLFIAIRDCQIEGSLEPIENLPLSIRRGLSMATMGEQIIRLVETSQSARTRGKDGGDKAAANMRAEREAREQYDRNVRYEKQKAGAVRPQQYLDILVLAAKGDAAAIAAINTSQEEAIKLCKRKNIEV